MARRPLATVDEVQRGAQRLMVLEELSSTTNLGAVFRSAAGLGIDGIILAPTCGDPLYRRAVRVSMGQVFAIPYARCESWPEPLAELRDEGWRVLALTPDARAQRHRRPARRAGRAARAADRRRGSGPVAAGARKRRASGCGFRMSAGVDSLNVAAAAAVAAYALRR